MWTTVLSIIAVISWSHATTDAVGRAVRSDDGPTLQQNDTVRISKHRLLFIDAKEAYSALAQGKYQGVDYLSFDPTDNTIVVRATEAGHKWIALAVANLDQDPKLQPPLVRKFVVRHKPAKDLMRSLKKETFKGIDFLSYDPTDNSIVARGTFDAMKAFGRRLAELDRK